jgi:hypothetical protein
MTMKSMALALLVGVSAPALAHEAKGPNGGRMVDAGSYHAELVAKQQTIEVYISDSADKPVAPAGFKAVAILVVGGKSQRITLEPAEGRLTGKAAVDVPANPKGVVQLTAPDGATAQAQFK